MKYEYPIFNKLKEYGYYGDLSYEELTYITSQLFNEDGIVLLFYHQFDLIEVYNSFNYRIYKEYSNGNCVKFKYDKNGDKIYEEYSDGYWEKYGYDDNGKRIYYEDSRGLWKKYEYDNNGKRIYYEDSSGYWKKQEYNDNGKRIYYEDSNGRIIDYS